MTQSCASEARTASRMASVEHVHECSRSAWQTWRKTQSSKSVDGHDVLPMRARSVVKQRGTPALCRGKAAVIEAANSRLELDVWGAWMSSIGESLSSPACSLISRMPCPEAALCWGVCGRLKRSVRAPACASVRQRAPACASVRQRATACDSVRQRATACDSVRQRATACDSVRQRSLRRLVHCRSHKDEQLSATFGDGALEHAHDCVSPGGWPN